MEPSAKHHDTGAYLSTTARRRMLLFTEDSLKFYATASLYKGKFNNSTLELSDGDEILRFKGMRIIRALVNHSVPLSPPHSPAMGFTQINYCLL